MKELKIWVAAVNNKLLILFAVTRNFTDGKEQSIKLATVESSTCSTVLVLGRPDNSEFSWGAKDS